MGIDLFGWSKWSPHLGNAVTIGTFAVPLVSGAGAALWAHMQGPGLFPTVIGLIVFMTMLWCCIGIVWLLDRQTTGGRKVIDSAWGIVTENYNIAFDPNGERYCQISLNLRNVLNWPLRVEIKDLFLLIENRAPDLKMDNEFLTFILMPQIPMTLSFPPYSRKQLSDVSKIGGRLSFLCHYGHPDGPHTRTMKRSMIFSNYEIPKSPFAMLPGIVAGHIPEIPVKTPLQVGPDKEDVDIPYRKLS